MKPLAVAALGLSLALGAAGARANGRFPRAQHVVVGPGPSSRTIVVRATFGVIVSDDGGGTFRLLCEDAFEYLDGYDPAIALAGDGALLVGNRDSVLVTRDRCAIRRAPELYSQEVVDLTTDPSGQRVYAAVVSADATPRSFVARSDDRGRTFGVLGAALPGVVLVTVEVAPTNPLRVYATGFEVGTRRLVFFRADDGATLRETGARFGGASGAFVSGVDPANPDVVYVRATTTEDADAGTAEGATALLRSEDGGARFREVARTAGPMRGFALSSDGRRVWAGGPDPRDGLLRSDDAGPFRRVSEVPVECLRHHAGALYVCETYAPGGVALGRSMDGGDTVRPLLRFSEIQGPPRCPAGTLVQDICRLRWPVVRAFIDPPDGRDAGVTERPIDAGKEAAPPRDCGCDVPGAPSHRGPALGLAAAALGLWRRRAAGRRPPS